MTSLCRVKRSSRKHKIQRQHLLLHLPLLRIRRNNNRHKHSRLKRSKRRKSRRKSSTRTCEVFSRSTLPRGAPRNGRSSYAVRSFHRRSCRAQRARRHLRRQRDRLMCLQPHRVRIPPQKLCHHHHHHRHRHRHRHRHNNKKRRSSSHRRLRHRRWRKRKRRSR